MKHCNKCGFVGALDLFAAGDRYRDGVRPICKDCWNKRNREKHWTPSLKSTKIKKEDGFMITTEGLDILIQNGYARNREEAKRYLQC